VQQLLSLLEPQQPLAHLSDFAKAYGDEAFCRRLLQSCMGNAPKSAEKFKQALVWRQQQQELLTSRKFTLAGDYRVLGEDLVGRPVFYMCMKNQLLPIGQCLDHQVVVMLRAIDAMPRGVETSAHIWDLHGLSLRLNLNLSALAKMISVFETYFAGRMEELIIMDMPRVALSLKDALWPLLPERTKNKIKFMTVAETQQNLEGSCSDEVSSRIAAVMEQNRDRTLSLGARRQTWMQLGEHGEMVPFP